LLCTYETKINALKFYKLPEFIIFIASKNF
jgi:hypothetical protein